MWWVVGFSGSCCLFTRTGPALLVVLNTADEKREARTWEFLTTAPFTSSSRLEGRMSFQREKVVTQMQISGFNLEVAKMLY